MWLLLLVVIGAVWFAAWKYASFEAVRERLGEAQAFAKERPWIAGLAFAAIYAGLTAASAPVGPMLTLLAGAIFGNWIATAIVSVAATVGATGAMLLSRFLLRDWVATRFGNQAEPIQKKIETDGKYYLFALRLTPLMPFFLINLAIGPTRMKIWTFVWVSWVGMLAGTWIYANAGTALGTIDSLSDLLSPWVLASLTLLGLSPLIFRMLLKIPPRKMMMAAGCVIGSLLLVLVVAGWMRYRVAEAMQLTVREFTNAEYPEDPSLRSVRYGQYNGRSLTLTKRSDTTFDLAFESKNPHVARVVFKDVDLALFTPKRPEWVADNPDLTNIALSERQWNRQQVRFGGTGSPYLDVADGDGFERRALVSAELASSGLSAGMWEVLLYTQEYGQKVLYYHGWFSLPLGHYWDVAQHNTALSFWTNWRRLEHRCSCDGTPIKLDELRTVTREEQTRCSFDPNEPVFARGEQASRRRTMLAENVLTWKDFSDGRSVRFASLVAPGRFTLSKLHGNEFRRIDQFERALVREIKSPADNAVRNEIELVFNSSHGAGKSRFLISGFRWDRLPAAAAEEYHRGLSMPIGIGVPPIHQDYSTLAAAPPHRSPYFAFFMDEAGRWIDHQKLGIDGPIIHRDSQNPNRAHLYLTSYGRHTLVGHWIIDRSQAVAANPYPLNYYR